MDNTKYQESKFRGGNQEMVKSLNSLRSQSQDPKDITVEEFVQSTHKISFREYLHELGITPEVDTIKNLATMPDNDATWLVPEIFLNALRLGMRKAPIWPRLIAGEQSVSGLSVTMPHFNMSDALPRRVKEGENIPMGTVAYGHKQVTLEKMGRGFSLTYEVVNYVALNLLSVFLQDMGIRLGNLLDSMAIDVLINGEQAGGTESAPTVGVTVPGTLAYRDILRVWVRMSWIGRPPQSMICGEDVAMTILELPEFKDRYTGTPNNELVPDTPIPTRTNLYIHSQVPIEQVIVLDPTTAMVKLNAQPLMIEAEKIIQNQTQATYASMITGMMVIYRNSRVIIDSTLPYVGNEFPTWMDPAAQQNAPLEQ